MKIGRIGFLLVGICLMALLILPVGAKERKPVSVGLDVLAARTEMRKAGLVNNDITFEATDFERALNVSSVSSITVAELPVRADGVLYLGNGEVSVGQTVSRENLCYLNFEFAREDIRDSSFRFTSNGGAYEIACKMSLLEEVNHSPIVSSATQTALSVGTYRDVTVYGSLEAFDPEGDRITFEIVRQPEKGILVMDDTSSGDYRYIPNAGYTGSDSFRYVAVDQYGNYSESATVSLKVEAQKNRLVYTDMTNRIAHVPAISLTEQGIMEEVKIDGKSCFEPEKGVTRLDFVVAAMKAVGLESVKDCEKTVFDDDGSIPKNLKGYVALATEKKYVYGKIQADGELLLDPDAGITRAEAAVILSRMIAAEAPTVKPVFADANSVPAWAKDAVETLADLGVMDSKGGYVNAGATLTREQTAYMLYMLQRVKSGSTEIAYR